MASRQDPHNGLIVFDPRFTTDDNVADQGAGNTDSSFNQAGAKPGRPTPVSGQTLVPVITGDQDTDVKLIITEGGYAGDVSFVYSVDDGSTYRGWNRQKAVRRYEPIIWTTNTLDIFDVAVIPSTQDMVLVYGEHNGASTLKSYRYTASTKTWSDQGTFSSAETWHAVTVACEPTTERLVAVAAADTGAIYTWHSTDSGENWTQATESAEDTTIANTVDRARSVYIGDNLLVVFQRQQPADGFYQYASDDHGHNLFYIDETVDANWVDLCALTNSQGAFVVYQDDTTNYPVYTTVGNAFESIADQSTTNLETSSHNYVACYNDLDGYIYYVARTAANPEELQIYRSVDNGSSFSDSLTWFQSNNAGSYPERLCLVSTMGELSLIVNHQANTNTAYEDSISRLIISEFSNIELDRVPTHTWVAWDLPSDYAGTKWTAHGTTAGSIDSDGLLYLNTTSSQNTWYSFAGTSTSLTPVARFSVKVAASTGGTSLNHVGATLISGDGADEYEIQLRMDTGDVVLYDLHGSASRATANIDLTTEHEFMMYFPSEGTATCVYREMGDLDWTVLGSSVTVTGSGAASTNWAFEFGNRSLVGATTYWKYVTLWNNNGAAIENSASSFIGKQVARSAYPVPEINSGSTAGFIGIHGGLGLRGEVYDIPTSYTYGLSEALPESSPSPKREWRSSDLTEQTIVFDLGDESWVGDALALYIGKANFQTAYLESYNGSSWDTRGTYNGATGFETLGFARNGDMISPTSGSSSADRFIQAGEFVGGYAILPSSKVRKITFNSSGLWADNVTTSRPKFRLADIDGTEASSGNVDLIAPSGVLVVYPTSQITEQYWRVRIPVQDVAESYYKAGIIGVGRVLPMGQNWSWGWTQRATPNFGSSTDVAGTEFRTKLGERQREWSFGWPDAVDLRSIREDSEQDYIGISGGLPIATKEDVWFALKGALEETEQATIPLVAVAALPTSTGTLTDPSLVLYGYFNGSIQVSHIDGTEGAGERVRIESITVTEIV